jgi:ketol-acid reductoisomerase
MLPIYHERDCPADAIRGWSLAVLGYGNQGRAQALNLRDSGHAVLVSGRPQGAGMQAASAEGFAAVLPAHLPRQADLVAVLTPDETHRVQVNALSSAARGGGRVKMLVFAHGFSLRFDPPELDPSWDVAVVAPAGPGVQLRSRYQGGSGIPALVAVHQDASGQARERTLAYAAAIGCARSGCLLTTMAEEAEVDLFGEQSVLCGGMNALCRAAFDVLVEAGYPEEMAYLECVQQLRLTAELVERYGVEGMRRRISPTALFGDLSRGERLIDADVRNRMSEILREVRDGTFAREWLATCADPEWPGAQLMRAHDMRLERAGEVIRRLYAGRAGEGDGSTTGFLTQEKDPCRDEGLGKGD